MNHYQGSGYGAAPWQKPFKRVFGVTPDHYLVVNYQALCLCDAIGGIEVNLPTYVDDANSYFHPANKP